MRQQLRCPSTPCLMPTGALSCRPRPSRFFWALYPLMHGSLVFVALEGKTKPAISKKEKKNQRGRFSSGSSLLLFVFISAVFRSSTAFFYGGSDTVNPAIAGGVVDIGRPLLRGMAFGITMSSLELQQKTTATGAVNEDLPSRDPMLRIYCCFLHLCFELHYPHEGCLQNCPTHS